MADVNVAFNFRSIKVIPNAEVILSYLFNLEPGNFQGANIFYFRIKAYLI